MGLFPGSLLCVCIQASPSLMEGPSWKRPACCSVGGTDTGSLAWGSRSSLYFSELSRSGDGNEAIGALIQNYIREIEELR